MRLYHYRCSIKSLLWQGQGADPCRICPVIFFFSQQHSVRVRAQVVQRGAIQQDNYRKTWPMLCGTVNEFPLLFHSWQEFLITVSLAFFFSRNRLVKCHAKCKLINKQQLWILCSLYYSALLCLMWCPIQIPGSDFLFGTLSRGGVWLAQFIFLLRSKVEQEWMTQL